MSSAGTKISVEYLLDTVLKHRWLVLIPFSLAMGVGIYLAVTLPKVYQAQTLILIQPQRVPTEFVRSVVSSDIDERISTISQQIMSRTNLEKVIHEFNLFSGNQDLFMEDMVAQIRKRIGVDVTRDRKGADAFSISFKGGNPQKVTQVTNALAGFFIEENLKVREAQAVGTSDFLQDELEGMQDRLATLEQRLKTFRIQNMGALPEQLETNLRILERLQEDLNSKQLRLRDARQLQVSLEKERAETNRALNRPPAPAGAQPQPVPGSQSELEALRTKLEGLRGRYTDRHPDIIRLQKQIEKLEEQRSEAGGNGIEAKGGGAAPAPAPNPAAGIQQRSLARQLEDVNREIAMLEFEIPKISEKIKVYQLRVEETPRIEQELLSLKRDYDNIKNSYDSLLERKLEAEISVNMEKKQKGEQFRIIDPARVPAKPIAPDMQRLLFMTVAAGLGIGAGLIFLFEYFDRSYRSPDEIEGHLGLKVVAMIPVIETPKIRWMSRVNAAFTVLISVMAFGLLGSLAAITMVGEKQTLQLVKKLLSL